MAVIGAGAAGLCCARHLSRYPELFQFKVLEKMKEVGGTWLYSPCPTTASGGETHSSMYKNLRYCDDSVTVIGGGSWGGPPSSIECLHEVWSRGCGVSLP